VWLAVRAKPASTILVAIQKISVPAKIAKPKSVLAVHTDPVNVMEMSMVMIACHA
jgi:hypothetical protein